MRADQFLHVNNYAESRQKAQTLIKNGSVEIDGVKIVKPSAEIFDGIPHKVILTSDEKYVGRG